MTLTLTVGCGALATIVCVSNALRASDHIVRVDNTVAELSHFIADSHASIREHVATGESLDEAVAAFDAGVERRIARIQAALNQAAGLAWWTSQLRSGLDLRRIDEDHRAYVAAATTAAADVGDRALSLRRFELYGQKLIVTVEAARDSVEPSRVQALGDANAMVMLALGIGGLIIAYLVWLPVIGRARLQAPITPAGPTRIRRIAALF